MEALGIPWRVFNASALESGDLAGAFKFFGEKPEGPVLYRGWILRPADYATLHTELSQHGCAMITSPAAYRAGLLFPEFFPAIADHSFPAVWSEGKHVQRAVEKARQLGPGPYFIKDYAKSAKDLWPEGCVAADEVSLPATIRTLVRYRAHRFEGGIVVRPLIQLRYLDEHPFGGKVFEEYRLFFFQGKLISQTAYDRIGGEAGRLPDYRFLGERIASPFFSADVVVTEADQYFVMEMGDGGASSLPPEVDPSEFYQAIQETLLAQNQRKLNSPGPV